MKIYRVGGAVRDKLLHKKIHDEDFVVVGATEEEMLHLGYKKVGKRFPVFLHPQTKAEYALARKEVKTGPRHQDFHFIFTPDITLEEDSFRRDFTCNALYEDLSTQEIIDFHHGKEDIEKHILRHISAHFAEDPLRVLRLCRFAATLNFTAAEETLSLCRQMVQEGAVSHLSKPRIWGELEKALSSQAVDKFILTAEACTVWKKLFPEIQNTQYLVRLFQDNKITDPMVNLAVLLYRLDRTDIANIAKRLYLPLRYKDFVFFTATHQHIPQNDVETALMALELASHQQENFLNRYVTFMQTVATENNPDLSRFLMHLQHLTKQAEIHKVTELPNFDDLKAKLQNHQMTSADLKTCFAHYLLTLK
jgi:tRNA nucleotidyltransferase (CCA-adding enzyme)